MREMNGRFTRLSRCAAVFVTLGLALLAANVKPAGAAPKQLTFVYSAAALQIPYFVTQAHFIEAAAAKIGGIRVIVTDGQNSAAKQISDVEAAIAQHVDGIIISPLTVSTLVPALREAAGRNVPVVTIDREAIGAPTLAHVSADNVAIGKTAAQSVVRSLNGKGIVVLLTGTPGSSAAIDRSTGVMQALSAAPGITLAVNQTAQFDRATAITVTEAALDRLPHVDAIIAENDDMALGAALAVKAKGLTGKVIITGADAVPDALRAIAAGSMTGTVEQFGDRQAAEAVAILAAFVRNHTKPKSHDQFVVPMLITKANLSSAVAKQ
jgi:ABC-type sugar transport system substrate-binding protein